MKTNDKQMKKTDDSHKNRASSPNKRDTKQMGNGISTTSIKSQSPYMLRSSSISNDVLNITDDIIKISDKKRPHNESELTSNRTKKQKENGCERIQQKSCKVKMNGSSCKDDSSSRKLRNVRAPKLLKEQIDSFVKNEKCYYHTFETGFMVPYVLPFDIMLLSCYCGKQFKQLSGTALRVHLRNIPMQCIQNNCNTSDPVETIKYKGKKYDDLLRKPVFKFDGKNVCLRIHPELTSMACVCGFVKSFDLMVPHMKKCAMISDIRRKINDCGLKTITAVENNANPYALSYYFIADENKKEFISEMNLKTMNNYQIYDPLGDGSAQFHIPCKNELNDKSIRNKIIDLDVIISTNWDKVQQMISSGVNGATEIQSKRFEIFLSFDKPNNQLPFWKCFCNKFDYKSSDIDDVLCYARKKTIHDLGKKRFDEGNISTPSLIFCKNNRRQAFHLDIMKGPNQKQYVMNLSHRSATSVICRPQSTLKINNIDALTSVLLEGTTSESKGYEMNQKWMVPSQELIDHIKQLPQSTQTMKNLNDGFGDLFYICNESTNSNTFDWTSYKVCDVPCGSITMANGGVIHAGSEAEHNDVRTVLFWTWTNKDCLQYNSDVQETKLTLMIQLAQDVWNRLKENGDLKQKTELLTLVYYCFSTSENLYCSTYSNTLRNIKHIPSLLNEFSKTKHDKVQQIMELIDKYSRKKDMFQIVNR